MIIVIAEQTAGRLNRATWEAIAAAQRIESEVTVAVLGSNVRSVASELATAAVTEVVLVDDQRLESYTADGFVQALKLLIDSEQPSLVVLPHTYQTRDFAPKLAARLDRALVTDCVGIKKRDVGVAFVRSVFQGKLCADVVPDGPVPHFITFQVGAFPADSVVRNTVPAPTRRALFAIDTTAIRQKPEAPFQETKQAVDLSRAERIVAIGRGIKNQQHVALAQELAAVFGAELAASRPICDAGWLPMDRQVGSSGQTVAPKLYLALGISGAIQHVVGMKGSRTIVAINKDTDAPIFEIADYGIAGDLFEIVPALLKTLRQ